MLLLLNVSEIFGKTGATGASNLQTLGTMLTASGDWISIILDFRQIGRSEPEQLINHRLVSHPAELLSSAPPEQ
jgi:hypothetical protein